MSNAATVAKSMRTTAKNIARLPEGIVSDTALAAVGFADQEGGTFFGGRAQLFGEVKQVRNNKQSATALVIGRPAGAWVIKSFGRKSVTPVRRTTLRGFTGGRMWFAKRTGPAGPTSKGHWDRVEEQTERVFTDIADNLMEGAISG